MLSRREPPNQTDLFGLAVAVLQVGAFLLVLAGASEDPEDEVDEDEGEGRFDVPKGPT